MRTHGNPPVLAVTPGDPAGIGPELALRALARIPPATARLRVYASRGLLRRTAETSGIEFPDVPFCNEPDDPSVAGSHAVVDIPFNAERAFRFGAVDAACGAYAVECIEAAAAAVASGRADAVVTMPISKESARLAGCRFPGHTEMLAAIAGVSVPPVMAFYSSSVAAGGPGGGLFVALATIHEPLSRVPSLVTPETVLHAVRTAGESFRRMTGAEPKIGVLGLNPHSGENGLIGTDEKTSIIPAIEAARKLGFDAAGPLVPDAAFSFLGKSILSGGSDAPPFDVYVAMYHDQALCPFKAVAFDSGVNVTLGLPFVRTSPDHGTAFQIAGRGIASTGSAEAAILLAARMARRNPQPR